MFLSTESKAFLKSMKIMAASFWWFLISSMMRLRARICEYVDRRGLNPFWFGRKIFTFLAQSLIVKGDVKRCLLVNWTTVHQALNLLVFKKSYRDLLYLSILENTQFGDKTMPVL